MPMLLPTPLPMATRIGAVCAGLVLFAVTAFAVAVDHQVAATVREERLHALTAHAAAIGADVDHRVGVARVDVLALRDGPDVRDLARLQPGIARAAGLGADDTASIAWAAARDRLAQRFVSDMAERPTVFQLRYMDARPPGREVVRVERLPGGDPVVIGDADLQAKADRDYVSKALELPAGAVFISALDLNQERGTIQVPHVPTLRFAAPVDAPDGSRVGVLVLNLDMGMVLDGVIRVPDERALYVVDGDGNYLLHPDPGRTFGFQLGSPQRVQDDIPGIASAVGSQRSFAAVVEDASGRSLAIATAPSRVAGGPILTFVEAIPVDHLLEVHRGLRRVGFAIGALAVGTAVIAAMGLARSLTRPLADLTEAVEAFGDGRVDRISARVVRGGAGEVAVLARAFERMSDALRERTAALAREEERFRVVVEASPFAKVLVDEAGCITLVNRAAERLFGYERAELIGGPVDILVPEAAREGHRALVRAYLDQPEARPMGRGRDLRGRRRDGSLFPIEVALTPIVTPAGPSVLASVDDITERRRAEELELDNRRVHEMHRVRSEFFASMSHELRTPLNAIIGFSQLLADSERLDLPEVHRYSGHVLSAGQHLLELVNQVLDLAKLDAGKLEFFPVPFVLSDLVDAVAELLRPTCAKRRVAIRCDLAPTISEVEVDPMRFKQVLLNYLSNGVRFARESGVVTVRTRPEGETDFRIEVEDDGQGIAPEDLSKLFIEFQQVEAGRSGQREGTGLGLALTRRIVEAQGGHVGVDSTLGKGSVFFAVLPRRPVPPSTSAPATSSP